MNKILVSAMNGIIGYEILNHLKKKYYIIAIDNEKNGIASKVANEFLISPLGSSKEFINFIKKISKKVDLMFFYVDEELVNISKNLKDKNILNKIVISPPKTIENCCNKLKFYNILNRNKIITPKLKNNAPAFIKPIYGRGSKNCFFSNNSSIVKFFLNLKSYIIQQNVLGNEFTVDCYFNKNNKLIYALSRERLVKSNISLTNKITNNQNLQNICNKVSSIFKFTGPINFQFIIDHKTKIPYLIEINPRLSGGVFFAIQCGFDPIDMAIEERLNNNIVIPKKIKYGKYTRYLVSKKI
jgi:carbamoyl-phosphate synthase large subunit